MLLPSKINIILPISSAALPQSLRIRPYYLAENEFRQNALKVYAKINKDTDNYKEKLYIKQKGNCLYCKAALAGINKNPFFLDILTAGLIIYDKNKTTEIQKCSKITNKATSFLNSLVLLHKVCHIKITQKSDSREPSAGRLAC